MLVRNVLLHPMFIFPSVTFPKDRKDFTRSVLEMLTGSLELPERISFCVSSHI